MSNADDIVTRIREVADSEVYRADIRVSKLYEAAEEIEYLRADRDRWKSLAIHNDNLAQIQAGIYPIISHYEEK